MPVYYPIGLWLTSNPKYQWPLQMINLQWPQLTCKHEPKLDMKSLSVSFKTITHAQLLLPFVSWWAPFSWTLDCISPCAHDHWGTFQSLLPLRYLFNPFQGLWKKRQICTGKQDANYPNIKFEKLNHQVKAFNCTLLSCVRPLERICIFLPIYEDTEENPK